MEFTDFPPACQKLIKVQLDTLRMSSRYSSWPYTIIDTYRTGSAQLLHLNHYSLLNMIMWYELPFFDSLSGMLSPSWGSTLTNPFAISMKLFRCLVFNYESSRISHENPSAPWSYHQRRWCVGTEWKNQQWGAPVVIPWPPSPNHSTSLHTSCTP